VLNGHWAIVSSFYCEPAALADHAELAAGLRAHVRLPLIVLIILFQPELRAVLEKLGRSASASARNGLTLRQ
jgi:DNA integrity scanning protein DisA with diadenylate cyclase activity